MRNLLAALLLVAAVLTVYYASIGGEQGAGQRLKESGPRIAAHLAGIDP